MNPFRVNGLMGLCVQGFQIDGLWVEYIAKIPHAYESKRIYLLKKPIILEELFTNQPSR